MEDEPIVAMDLEQTLDSLGYSVIAVGSGEAALAHAETHRPDLVLMDIRIDGPRDGIEIATLLHERHGVPIVYLTAHSDEATLARAKRAEPYGYLLKPINHAALRSAIEVALHKHGMVHREIDGLRTTVDALKASSTRDELTGLLNRRGFLDLARSAVQLANRTQRPLALVYLDLNGMKAINDALGHEVGDRALCAAADLMRMTFRTSDVLARLGGDEFVVVAPEYLEADDGEAITQRFHRHLARYRHEVPQPFVLSVSLGVAIYDPHEQSKEIEQLLVEADARMYASKARRRTQGTQRIPLP